MAIRSELGSPGLGCPRFVVKIGLFLIGAFLSGGFSIAVGFDLVALATVVTCAIPAWHPLKPDRLACPTRVGYYDV